MSYSRVEYYAYGVRLSDKVSSTETMQVELTGNQVQPMGHYKVEGEGNDDREGKTASSVYFAVFRTQPSDGSPIFAGTLRTLVLK